MNAISRIHFWCRLLTRTTLLAVAVFECSGEPGASLELDGRWPGFRRGAPKSVAIAGDYAYLAADDLQVIDVRDLSNPRRIGWCGIWEHPSERASRVVVLENHAYLVARNAGLVIVDVTSPDTPRKVGSYVTLGASGLAMGGKLAFVADMSGMTVIDVADPAHPVKVGSYGIGSARAVDVVGTRAYLATEDSGLEIVDVSNPAASTRIGRFSLNGVASDVRVVGDHAYLAAGGLRIVDVRDGAHPVSAGGAETTGGACAVVVSGRRAYVADAGGSTDGEGVVIFDVGDPLAPKRMGRCDVGGTGGALGLALSGDRSVFVAANHREGFQVFDVEQPGRTRRLGAYRPWGESLSAAGVGSYVYVADGLSGMQVIDVSDPANPLRVAQVDSFARSVTVSGNHAFLATNAEDTGEPQLEVLDVQDPQRPTAVGRCRVSCDARSTISADGHVYLVGRGGLAIVDIVDPTHPREVGALATAETVWSVALAVGRAYLAADTEGLLIVDVRDSTKPRLVGRHVGSFGFAFGVAASGSNVVLADGAMVRIIDASRPEVPKEVGACALAGARSVAVAGHYAVVARAMSSTVPDQGGLSLVDLADAAHPKVVASTSGFDGWAVALVGDRAMVAGQRDGLAMVRIRAEVRFDAMGRASEGFGFLLRGLPGQRVRLLRSEDLRQWDHWTNASLGSDALLIRDSEAASNSRRFYRAVVP